LILELRNSGTYHLFLISSLPSGPALREISASYPFCEEDELRASERSARPRVAPKKVNIFSLTEKKLVPIVNLFKKTMMASEWI